ncbi:MAG: phosphoglycerate mutase family protein [Bacteroidales bacterium]|nr:phosphoglycerate mutase family protein [Bacteroidales bacterium]
MNRKNLTVSWIITVTIIVVALVYVYFFCNVISEHTIVIVRHAEKESLTSPNPHLSAEGQIRAQELKRVLADIPFDAIFVTEYYRTHETADPLANYLGIVPIEFPANNTADLYNEVKNNYRNKKVLIVGHSNTIPALIGMFQAEPVIQVSENEYDNIFVIKSNINCTSPLLIMKYGEPN